MTADNHDERAALIHDLYVADLIRILESGQATAADRAVIRNFLRDNGITAKPVAGSPMDDLRRANNLPEFPEDRDTYN